MLLPFTPYSLTNTATPMKITIPVHFLVAYITLFIVACNQDKKNTGDEGKSQNQAGKQTNSELDQVLNAVRTKQAGGLGTGSIEIHKAWNYNGFSFLSAVPGARLIAVDATVTGHTADFDFDDIEVIDGANRTSYGSDPQITLLTPEGKALPDSHEFTSAPGPVRILLIYGFPKETEDFTLYYWGKNLLKENHNIEPSGWELPFPENKAK